MKKQLKKQLMSQVMKPLKKKLAVQAIKKGLRETVDPPWRDVGKMAITEIRRLMQTADAKESAAAFIEKRNPVFTGR